jgi:hypothetical protein
MKPKNTPPDDEALYPMRMVRRMRLLLTTMPDPRKRKHRSKSRPERTFPTKLGVIRHLRPTLESMQDIGYYTLEDVAYVLSQRDVPISGATLRSYLSRLRRRTPHVIEVIDASARSGSRPRRAARRPVLAPCGADPRSN